MSRYPANKPCPCGSGRKFKRCHGRVNPKRDALQRQRGFLRRLSDVFRINKIQESGGRRIQFVWWWHPKRWRLQLRFLPYPETGANKGYLYKWRIQLGPLEIRRWIKQ